MHSAAQIHIYSNRWTGFPLRTPIGAVAKGETARMLTASALRRVHGFDHHSSRALSAVWMHGGWKATILSYVQKRSYNAATPGECLGAEVAISTDSGKTSVERDPSSSGPPPRSYSARGSRL
jgi:hypothetical protein